MLSVPVQCQKVDCQVGLNTVDCCQHATQSLGLTVQLPRSQVDHLHVSFLCAALSGGFDEFRFCNSRRGGLLRRIRLGEVALAGLEEG